MAETPRPFEQSPLVSAEEVSRFHTFADTDVRPESIHHTLGTGHNQAARGDHKHPEYEGGSGGGGIPATIFDAKGDLIAASAADTAVRLGVGTDGQILSADSASPLGLKWIVAASGGTIPDATPTVKGVLQLAGDLSGTAVAPTVPGLAAKANLAHTHAATDIISGVLATARLGGGTANNTVFLRGDSTWAAPANDSPAQDWDWRMVPTNWSGLVGTRLTIPTHISPAGGQTTHPSVAFFPEKWNGYRYWMAHTAYPGSNDDHEDPNLAVSDDGITWIAAPGVTQPLDDADGTPEYNSDTDLVLGPDNRLYLFWRFYDSSLGSFQEKVYMRTSTDGVTWTAKTLVYQFTDTVRRPLSPSFIYEDGRWTVWAVDVHTPATPVITRMQNTGPDPTTGWGTMTDCTITAVPAGKAPWHLEVRRLGGQYVMILTTTDAGAGGVNGLIILATSGNGLSWLGGTQTVIPAAQAGEHDSLYRATFIAEVNDGIWCLRVWYSAYDSTGATVWNIYRTLLRVNPPTSTAPHAQAAGFASGLATIAASAGLTTVITFPAGRFSQPPIVTATSTMSSRLTIAVNVAPTTTGCSIRLDNWTAAQAVTPNGIYWQAIQMTASTAPGLLDSEPTQQMVATCDTPGCDNHGIPITLTVPLVVHHVVCGVCTQPILDVVV